MKAVSAAAAAILAARGAGTDAPADAAGRTEVVSVAVTPRCAVDIRNNQLVSDCCVHLAGDDFDCGAGYVKIATFRDTECQTRMFTTCARLGLKGLDNCGYTGFPVVIPAWDALPTGALPATCAEAEAVLQDSGLVKDVSDGTCYLSDQSRMFGMKFSCEEGSSSSTADSGTVPSPASPVVDTMSPTQFPSYHLVSSGAGPTPSPFFVDTWAPTRFPTQEVSGSGFGPTMAMSTPPTLSPTMTPTGAETPAPTHVDTTSRPTVHPTLAGAAWQGFTDPEVDSGSPMLVTSLKVSAALLTILICLL